MLCSVVHYRVVKCIVVMCSAAHHYARYVTIVTSYRKSQTPIISVYEVKCRTVKFNAVQVDAVQITTEQCSRVQGSAVH